MMKPLDPRKEKILVSIVNAYVDSAVPVGSRVLARSRRLDYSSSTIRNEMYDLEEMGYLTHPHTSAGRVPTDRGYRYFVDRFAAGAPVPAPLLNELTEVYRARIRNAEELLKRTLHILSSLSHQTSFIFIPEEESFVIKSVNLLRLEAALLMVFWISQTGLVKSCLVDMGERLSDEEISRLARFLNEELAGLSYEDIRLFVTEKLEACRDSLKHLYEKASRLLEESLLEDAQERMLLEGSVRMLDQPEFRNAERARPVLSILEEGGLIQRLLRSRVKAEGVTVTIGSEAHESLFRECSLVAAPCYQRERRVGILGLLGPRRMPYGRMMAIGKETARLAGENFERWFE